MLPNKYAKLTAGLLVTGALATWGLLGIPGGALANPPPHNHGGGGGGGSGGGGEPTGTVYFTTGGVFQGPLYTMNADGSNKNPVPNGILGEPSRALHGGQRWFLELHFIAGQFYPDGGQRREVFAVSESGALVQLTDQADLEPVPSVTFGATRWTPDDVFVSWVALHWDAGTGMPDDAGVYVAEIDYDTNTGDVVGLMGQPSAPLVPSEVVADSSEVWRPVVRTHDWSPDQTAIVYDTVDWELFTADGATGQSSLLLSTSRGGAGWPVWSPDGSKIAFQYGRGSTATINPDGSGEKTVFRGADIPQWSPDGGHLIHAVFGSLVQDERSDVYRTTAKGGAKVNLTADLDTRFLSGTPTSPVAWR